MSLQSRYLRPDSVEAACAALAQRGSPAVVLAGGQMLLQPASLRALAGSCLVDISRLPQLRGVECGTRKCFVGACVALAEWQRAMHGPGAALIAEVLATVGSSPIRNRATVGGSLAWASPRSEVLLLLWALEASVEIASEHSRREVPVREFLEEAGAVRLERGELIIGVHWTVPPDIEGWGFRELRLRRSGGRMIVAVIAKRHGHDRPISLVLCGLAHTPIELELPRSADPGHEWTAGALRDSVASRSPLADTDTSLEYRIHVAAEVGCWLARDTGSGTA